ncbi:gamma-glutamyl-gamma-aminobutyrate hydrolase family protein [Magnetospirillum sulfuroxidans]|uniref:Gamma-glutamyl-gamma-aminobutyrate hydrolase family protein n=1 Tax=Magnetospirillum sulfuroxidans TaxID=611300 RepID=A0ABS5IH44_9PROT|nr:gamma-glutamyl-gamma-aminobutyrate hydrolase family protein [Magnetospirillum sulfuroxidans]MBR9973746.1 gamma-glutamyl-gamma-aminobutyrate hydrolase family protein [Magnetospirillum sulfuroxidans]
MRVTQAASYAEPRDSLAQDWILRLQEWGMTPILVPNRLTDPVGYVAALTPDLVILTGGDDIGLTPDRDATEHALLAASIAARRPLLGICRGLQLLNLHLGGGLEPVIGHIAHPHSLTVTPSGAAILGSVGNVNSYHGFGIPAAALAPGLDSLAHDSAGNIEAARMPGLPVAGIMWHPERGIGRPQDQALFEYLVHGERL